MVKLRTVVYSIALLGFCLPFAGCLGQRLGAVQVVEHAQQTFDGMVACRTRLNAELSTDMFQDVLTVQVIEKRPNLQVRVLSASSPQLAGMAFKSDGDQSVSYFPHTNVVTVGPADVVRMPQVIETLVQAWREWLEQTDPQKAELSARVREQGLMVYKIDISVGQYTSAQYTIDARQWQVRQVSYDDEFMGRGVVRLETVECFDDLDSATFDLDIPDGVMVDEVKIQDNRPLTLAEAQAKVGFHLHVPQYLPADTAFLVAYQLDKNMALVYTGKMPFTLVQGPNIGAAPQDKTTLLSVHGRQATLVQDQEHSGLLLTWREGDLQFSIAGTLSQSEILQIAESLQ